MSDLMSGSLESGCFVGKTFSVRWKVTVPIWYRIAEPGTLERSPTFYFGNRNWFFDCVHNDGDIYLRIFACESPCWAPPLNVFVRVDNGSNGRVLPELKQTMRHWSAREVVHGFILWHREINDIQLAVPSFRFERQLTFLVTFEETESMTDETTDSASLSAGQVISCDKNLYLCLESLAEDFSKLLDASLNPDVELHCEGQTTRAHKIILCTRSPVLASMLQSDMVEGRTGVANIRDMTNDTLQQFLRYLYTGKLDVLTFDAAMRLYEAGDMYGVKRLASRCSGFLISGLTVENACDALVVADLHSDSEFVEAVISFLLAKKIPMSGDSWQDFCKSHPILANTVYGRFCEMFCKEKS